MTTGKITDEKSDYYVNYQPKNKIRFVTATSLFDGHDASINIIRRLLQARGAEVIHLGHNRSVKEVVNAALQEDVHAIAISSYQGGHMEYFKYMRDLLLEEDSKHIKIFGGGGGVITPKEIEELVDFGICRLYSPEDGQYLGLEGIIGHMMFESDYSLTEEKPTELTLPRALTFLESEALDEKLAIEALKKPPKGRTKTPVVGITGTGGAGKSSLTDEIILRILLDNPNVKVGIICVDPSKKKTGGSLLGDRIRMNSASNSRVFLRSFATRGSGKEISKVAKSALNLMQQEDFDILMLESSGIGQGDTGILDLCDISMYVMTPEYGAATQLEKIDMLDFADLIAVNKYERPQGPDALRDIKAQLRRSRFGGQKVEDSKYPVFGTIASRFNDDGVNGVFAALMNLVNKHQGSKKFKVAKERKLSQASTQRESLIPAGRIHYLLDIANHVRDYHQNTESLAAEFNKLNAAETLLSEDDLTPSTKSELESLLEKISISEDAKLQVDQWKVRSAQYKEDKFTYKVRRKEIKLATKFETLSGLNLPKVSLPKTENKADIYRFLRKENLPGTFPFTGGLFPFRRQGEDPTRQFAGEGGPARTNKRFHYLSKNSEAKRLSTAFDSVTLYGSDPDKRPDIFGKVGESGVSIATLDDMKTLYSGFDLCGQLTSVSMTINGPAPIILAMFLNAAIDQQVDEFQSKNNKLPSPKERQDIVDSTLQSVRGTVQADILKEDQAQNTCIFSTEFALKIMADIQEYFTEKKVRNYYSVSISGYHIAEAGANPISQIAFTLANGFTYVEYYLSRGLKIDDFAPNLSFFFSNGVDAEYAVLGRVARRIWAIAMRDLYGANERSQKLKYHIQTSGRSLHAQEIDFNDIRTTLQALIALYDNCNSLHTNAYDEAITTPTEESVRRAMAIQMIINEEFGPNKCENINQGSYFLEELTDLVEEAVLQEFESISRRGGVLGAMEMQYQRGKIQEESLLYEHKKHNGELPIIGVNTFQNPAILAGEYERPEIELIRASYDEKNDQLNRLESFKKSHKDQKRKALKNLAQAAIENQNVFAELMHTVRHASLGEITTALYEVGGQYRRNM